MQAYENKLYVRSVIVLTNAITFLESPLPPLTDYRCWCFSCLLDVSIQRIIAQWQTLQTSAGVYVLLLFNIRKHPAGGAKACFLGTYDTGICTGFTQCPLASAFHDVSVTLRGISLTVQVTVTTQSPPMTWEEQGALFFTSPRRY